MLPHGDVVHGLLFLDALGHVGLTVLHRGLVVVLVLLLLGPLDSQLLDHLAIVPLLPLPVARLG